MTADSIFTGNVVTMKTGHDLHYNNVKKPQLPGDDVSSSFGQLLKGTISRVNNLQVDAEDMTRKMIYQPESVDIHSVMIAQQKAELALSFTRSVRDEAIRAYRDIINMR